MSTLRQFTCKAFCFGTKCLLFDTLHKFPNDVISLFMPGLFPTLGNRVFLTTALAANIYDFIMMLTKPVYYIVYSCDLLLHVHTVYILVCDPVRVPCMYRYSCRVMHLVVLVCACMCVYMCVYTCMWSKTGCLVPYCSKITC